MPTESIAKARKILTRREAWDEYGFPLKTQHGWTHRGVGPPAYRVNGKVVYRRSEFEAWVFRNRIPGEGA